jgi:protein subunit release factor A
LSSRSIFDLPEKSRRGDELEKLLGAPDAWDDPNKAAKLARQASEYRDEVAAWDQLERRARDLEELDELAHED